MGNEKKAALKTLLIKRFSGLTVLHIILFITVVFFGEDDFQSKRYDGILKILFLFLPFYALTAIYFELSKFIDGDDDEYI